MTRRSLSAGRRSETSFPAVTASLSGRPSVYPHAQLFDTCPKTDHRLILRRVHSVILHWFLSFVIRKTLAFCPMVEKYPASFTLSTSPCLDLVRAKLTLAVSRRRRSKRKGPNYFFLSRLSSDTILAHIPGPELAFELDSHRILLGLRDEQPLMHLHVPCVEK